MKIFSEILIIISFITVFLYCSKSTSPGSEEFKGIAETDETGAIINDDPNDWQPRIKGGLFPEDSLSSHPAYPNPFTSSITIGISLPRSYHVKVTINNNPSNIIRTLIDSEMVPGLHKVIWNRKNENDENVQKGIYRVYITATSSIGNKFKTYGDIEVNN